MEGLDLWAKCEFVNPSGSHKDRIYLAMFQEAEARGRLRPGMTVIEASTGNAGAACALVGLIKGYPVKVVMPQGMSPERSKMIRALGAEVEFTPGGESDQDLAMERVQEIVEGEPGRFWYPDQFSNPDNVLAHYRGTGPEIWEQTGGDVGAVVAAVGSGGTLTGVGRFLKERNPGVKVFAVEPSECAILARGEWGTHHIQGIGDGFVPGNLDLELVDGVITVSSRQAIDAARRLARREGLFVGISSGCNVEAAAKLAASGFSGRIVTVLNDSGKKYFTSPLFGEMEELEIPERDHSLDEAVERELKAHRQRWLILD